MCNFCAKKILSKSRIICVLSMSRILFDPMSASVTETVVAQQNGYVKPLEPEKHCNGTTTNSKPCDLPSHTESFEVIPLWAAITTYFAFGLLILISYLRELLRRWGWIRYGAKVEGMKVSHGCSLSLCIYSRPRRLLHVHCACYICYHAVSRSSCSTSSGGGSFGGTTQHQGGESHATYVTPIAATLLCMQISLLLIVTVHTCNVVS